ncbi:metallophosphoesterase [Nissabacter sp. SGAir0207]|uniref:metallophosphoesterase family protein n=1 Tax=Nissabacter sp. SGAir0207 TaxID=2126321 RepID=UPI0010CD2A99|nr:metallophosphoesterase family protein [Nissabacter sp. SGAir0207]QCR38868.1 YfcE family phosphodiesterase [Nissabacter sp. SGAir0207]
MKFAALSDIHGNVSALNAVLQDIAGQGVDFTVNLGDIVSGGLFPAETAERLLPLNFPTIKGNHERQLLEMPFDKMGLSDQHAFQQLQPAHWEWLRALPAELTLHDEIVMVHGVPGNDTTYLLEEVSASSVRPSSVTRVSDYVKHLDATLILCGHTHIPRLLELNSGCVIVNPGSVGLQAYDDDRPFYHKMESGSPHARYALLEKRHGKWAVEFRKVSYDWEEAANAARNNQRPDWVNALRTGRMG